MITLEKIIRFKIYPENFGPMRWHSAMELAEKKKLRLPTMDELLVIYDNKDNLPFLADIARSSTHARWVWSSETHPDARNNARIRSVANGYDFWGSKDYAGVSVVCVSSEL